MKKISTLYKKDPNDLSRIINELDPNNEWVFTVGIPTRKYDGTAAAIINGKLYKRYDVKKGKTVPLNAIPCQEPDKITGHWPHWVECDINKAEDKYFLEAFEKLDNKEDGTYELIGEKINSNHEHLAGHILIKHGITILPIKDFSFEGIKNYFLSGVDIEGIVFHANDGSGRMCKIRKHDYGIQR